MNLAGSATIVLIAVVTVAAYLDLRTGKVPNAVTVPVITVGIVLMTVSQGLHGLLLSIGGIGLALAVWVVTALLGGSLGGGDIKLLAAVGALTGPVFLVRVFVAAVFVGGLWALATAIRHGMLLASLRHIWAGICCAAAARVPSQLTNESGGLRIPYAPAIAIGTMTAWLWPGV